MTPAKFWLGNLQNPANMVMAGVTGKIWGWLNPTEMNKYRFSPDFCERSFLTTCNTLFCCRLISLQNWWKGKRPGRSCLLVLAHSHARSFHAYQGEEDHWVHLLYLLASPSRKGHKRKEMNAKRFSLFLFYARDRIEYLNPIDVSNSVFVVRGRCSKLRFFFHDLCLSLDWYLDLSS